MGLRCLFFRLFYWKRTTSDTMFQRHVGLQQQQQGRVGLGRVLSHNVCNTANLTKSTCRVKRPEPTNHRDATRQAGYQSTVHSREVTESKIQYLYIIVDFPSNQQMFRIPNCERMYLHRDQFVPIVLCSGSIYRKYRFF